MYDQAVFVDTAVHNVRDAILIGGLFSILILLAFQFIAWLNFWELVDALGRRQLAQGLLEIDDVDTGALGEDEAAHLGVPAARLMAEMDPGFEEIL